MVSLKDGDLHIKASNGHQFLIINYLILAT